MLVKSVQIKNFRSISDSGIVEFDKNYTVLVGKNESGKTAFLSAIHKANSVEGDIKYNVVEDYPRKALIKYQKTHEDNPDVVATITYELTDDEVKSINTDFCVVVLENKHFSENYNYANSRTITFSCNQKKYIDFLATNASFTSETKSLIKNCDSVAKVLKELAEATLNENEKKLTDEITKQMNKYTASWNDILSRYIYFEYIESKMPKFLYFDEYHLLPGKINLNTLKNKKNQAESTKTPLDEESRVVLSLLEMANIELDDLINTTSYEEFKAQLEAISAEITGLVFKYWSQNKQIRVQFDIRNDPKDIAPFNSGNNLYIRIESLKHFVTVPFGQRSRGFIWFFSFIIWFNNVKNKHDSKLILLLDEPGLSLHALAQYDLMSYIEELSNHNQIIYTTHSPFMIKSERLDVARTVEDFEDKGTVVSNDLNGSEPNTVFPLQAAIGYTIAQNLFISKHNLLIEGPADLLYLKHISMILSEKGKTYLNDKITIVPVGGLDNIATFVALLKGNNLNFVILHDYDGKKVQRLENLVTNNILKQKYVLNYAMFRGGVFTDDRAQWQESDVEDLLGVELYTEIFNSTFADKLSGKKVADSDIDKDRIILSINKWLKDNKIILKQDGTFNHYLPALHFISEHSFIEKTDDVTLTRFEALFEKINSLLN
jgi:predicted ATP-dependent endonuclease of OLD family